MRLVSKEEINSNTIKTKSSFLQCYPYYHQKLAIAISTSRTIIIPTVVNSLKTACTLLSVLKVKYVARKMSGASNIPVYSGANTRRNILKAV